MVVRPRESSASESWICCSVTLSSALVASSRMSSGGSLRKARAMEMRCFCPPESLTPPLAHLGVVAVRERHGEVVDVGALGRLDDGRLARVGVAVGDVFADAAAVEEHVLRDDAHAAPQGAAGDGADIDAAECGWRPRPARRSGG